MKTLPLSEAKATLSALAEHIETTHDQVEVTKHGRRSLVILSADEYDSMAETIFWLSQPGILEELSESPGDIAEGRALTTDEIRAWVDAGMPDTPIA